MLYRVRFVLALALLGLVTLGSTASSAQETAREHVNVLSASGLIDSVLADGIGDAVRTAERDGAIALVIQLDSPGVVIDRAEYRDLLDLLDNTSVPIGVWVGPAGASARFASAELLTPADVRGRGPGTTLGTGASGLVLQAPTLGDFIVSLDGAQTRAGRLDTAVVEVNEEGQPRRKPNVEVRFVEPAFVARLLHITASPAVSFLLLLAGIGLLLLELFSLGGGLAAGTAVVCLLPAAYGLGELPTKPLGLALLLGSGVAAGVDVQAGTARFWTAVSALAVVAGTVTLFGEGLGGPVRIPWPAAVAGIAGYLLLIIRAMPSVVRSRTTAGATAPGSPADTVESHTNPDMEDSSL
jgi:membrane-bound serine protease (ClpP class)